ncbi:MAG TPA: tetratricopeptide repeat protein, partial [Candidatus Acidoferrum sp.]|nr:tetratricopeptide repeat protein [Candidatus Acidoferrum sp.]
MARASREDPPFRPFAPKRILVVGCGSDLPFSVAAEQPDAEVLGIDEDPAIVAVAEEAAAQAALPNLAFLAADLGDSSSVPGDFDWIHCPDAVKPFGDEASAWRTLAQHLAGNGLLTARLRSRRQEYAGDNFREAINILAQAEPPADLDDWLRLGHRLARDLGQGATPLGPISRTVAARLRQTPPHVAASALLPAGHAHTPDSFRALLTKAGLAQYGFLDEEAWRPEGIIDAPDILALIDGLSRDERDEVVDILRAPDLLLVCGHPRPEKEQMPSRPSGSTTDGGVRPSRAGLDDALAGAARLHGSGDLPGAETICRQILSGVPGHPGALDLLGRIAHQRGDHPAALEFIGRAIAAEPSEPSHHGNLGVVYQAAGELGRASECMTTALALRPDSPEAHNNLGTVLQAQGKLEEALAQYREALRRRPDMAEGHRNLGTVL